MGHPAVFAPEVAHRRRDVDHRNAPPGQPDGGFRFKIEASHKPGFLECAQQRRNRIHAETEQRIADARAQRDQVRPEIGDPVP